MQIVTEYPLWFVIFCLILGAIYSVLLYRNDKKISEFKNWLVNFLAILRFLLVSFLSFLLLSPLIQHLSRRVEAPIVIIAQDNSSSILLNEDSSYYHNEYVEELQKLENELGKDYELVSYTFGESINTSLKKVNFKDRTSNMSLLLKQIEDRYANRNVGALILASDGIYNQGSNPVYSAGNFDFPIYTVALGDTNIKKDLIIQKINQNQIAYFGNQFPVVVDITALKAQGHTFSLSIEKNGRTLFSQSIRSDSDDLSKSISINLKASEKGLQKYTVRLSVLEDEISIKNNVEDFYIDVLDGRQRILILANSVHPDIKAITRSIEKNENYEVDVMLASSLKKDPSAYDLIILHQLPSNQYRIPNILNATEGKEHNLLFILGQQTALSVLNNTAIGQKIVASSMQLNEVQAVLVKNFPLFKLSEDFEKIVEGNPPLYSPFGEYSISGQTYSLLNQKIGMVETEKPLIFYHQKENRKIGFINAEGLWKWKLAEYARQQSTDVFDELILKSVQYLSLKSDQGFFRLSSDNEFYENEAVTFDAELYNNSYELINEPEIEMIISDGDANTYPYTFSRLGNAYHLNTGVLPVGEYSYEANVKVGTKSMKEVGEFSVKAIQLEENKTIADHQLMNQIALNSGGQMVYPRDLSSLQQFLSERDDLKSISYSEERVRDIIHLKWIFFLLLALMSLEWFLRKRNGAY